MRQYIQNIIDIHTVYCIYWIYIEYTDLCIFNRDSVGAWIAVDSLTET